MKITAVVLTTIMLSGIQYDPQEPFGVCGKPLVHKCVEQPGRNPARCTFWEYRDDEHFISRITAPHHDDSDDDSDDDENTGTVMVWLPGWAG